MHNPSVPTMTFLVLFLESLFFGAFCILYLFSLWVLVCRQRRQPHSASSLSMIAIVTIMFILTGLLLALDVGYPMKAFVEHSGTPNGPINYLNQQANDSSLNMLHPVLFAIMTFLGDAFMTYRIYVVWNQQLISLVVPILLLVGDIVAGAFSAEALIHGPKTYYTISAPNASAKLIAYFSMTLLTNVVTTLLILGRLWLNDNSVKQYRTAEASTSVHWQVMKTIVQSQSAYSLGVIFNVVAFATHSNLAILTSAMLPTLLGISFTLIITRIGFSEMLGNGSDGSLTETHTMHFNERGRSLSPISVDVFISRTDNSPDAQCLHDKTVDLPAMGA
ncbi:uncharacterized protein TRAVEDRAFT_53243 [Trametes versicolor FP-101664 SS1]|uniref:uncharacterized protein n=1 Tax=Trametes versicolor (strain FP-101664) TaxID=717944 RepID=UPI0004622ED2|nr:uncharacterized protein TRAVEDRAFT_53243 [Trametes versicolor FP-101664 SS1]EIW52804.1 hypothetical protein TRAVEDRAFT_53243 [Trametes versicolor FP-101664 SS1]